MSVGTTEFETKVKVELYGIRDERDKVLLCLNRTVLFTVLAEVRHCKKGTPSISLIN